jgi:hypothetical protein
MDKKIDYNKLEKVKAELEKAQNSYSYFSDGVKVLKTSLYAVLLAGSLVTPEVAKTIYFLDIPYVKKMKIEYNNGNRSGLEKMRSSEAGKEYCKLYLSEIDEPFQKKKWGLAGLAGLSALNMIGGIYVIRKKKNRIEPLVKKINELIE